MNISQPNVADIISKTYQNWLMYVEEGQMWSL